MICLRKLKVKIDKQVFNLEVGQKAPEKVEDFWKKDKQFEPLKKMKAICSESEFNKIIEDAKKQKEKDSEQNETEKLVKSQIDKPVESLSQTGLSKDNKK